MIGIFIGLIVATNFFSFSASEKDIQEAFANTGFSPEDHYSESTEGKLHYVTVGDPSKPPVLLIHGSPGSWDNWLDVITKTDFLDHYFAIAIDRAGYNKTTLTGKYSLQEQSAFLEPLIHQYCKPCVVAGHSYGGALALQTAKDYHSSVSAVISVAGTVADSLQDPRFYNYILKYTPLKWIIANNLMASNREMMGLEEDLPKMEAGLSGFKGKVALIQGNEDVLVHPDSPAYLKPKFSPSAQVRLFTRDEMNHFVIWSDKDLVMEALAWAHQN